MKRRLKFIWGASRVIKGRWYLGLFGFYDRVEGEPDSGLAVSLRGLLCWLTGLAMAGYIAAAAALTLWLDRNPYNQVSFGDALTLPVRWQHFQKMRGQSLIAEGRADLKGGRWADALFRLRAGLARDPGDLTARLLLAQFYVATNQRPLARRTLDEGLSDTFPGREYLEAVLALATQAEDYATIESVAARYLPGLNTPAQVRARRWLTERRLQNQIESGQSERVLGFKQTERVVPEAMVNEFRVMALLKLGRAQEAVHELQTWLERSPVDEDVVMRLLVRAAREAGQLEIMDQALARLTARSPDAPSPYVFRVVQLTMAGRGEAAREALEDYFRRFGASLENLRLVSEPLATIKAATELGRIVELAREQGFPTRGLRLFQAQAFLSDGAPGEANRILSLVSADGSGPGAKSGILRPAAAGNPRLAAYEQATLVWLQVVATALISPAPAAQSALLEALAKRPNTVASLRELVLLLRKAGRTETAEAVLRRGEGPYPENPWIREQLAEVRAAAAQAAGKVESRPAEATVVGEKPFFTQLNERIGAGDWAAAQKQIRELRTAKPAPAWLSQRDADLLLAQIRIEHGLQDRLAMLIAVKLYLDGDVRRSQATLAFAQEIHAAGAKEEALLVVREVLRKTPDFPPAERLRAAWTPAKK